MKPRYFGVIAALFVLLLATQINARGRRRGRGIQDFPASTVAKMVHLIDADTAWFEIAGKGRFKGRFYGINAPECHKRQVHTRQFRSARCASDDEYFGLAAYGIAQGLLAGKRVVLNCPRTRRGRCKTGGFGRILVTVTVGAADLMETLVARGAAWTFTKYPSKNHRRLCQLENTARRKRVGMWAVGVKRVLAGMRSRTRKWYSKRDGYCRRLLARGGGRGRR